MADRKSQELSESLVDGFLQYDYSETWQVEASGIAEALSDSGLPQIGQPYLISGTSATVYCFRRQPRRRSDTLAKGLFDVVCSFSNAVTRYERTVDGLPANEPEQIVPRVDIAFEEYSEQSGYAQFVGVFPMDQPLDELSPEFSKEVPPYMPQPQFGVETEIINSARDPIENVTKRRHTKRITYWSWHRDWETTWDDYLDTVNDAEVTITQSDKDGQRLRYTFPKYTLLINDIIKEDHWRDGRLYFRRGVVFSHNPETWLMRFTDKGFNEMLFVGQAKEDVGRVFGIFSPMTSDDMDELFGSTRGQYESSPIVQFKTPTLTLINFDILPVPPADPKLLNGYGRMLSYPTPYDDGVPKNVVYMPYTVSDFSLLGIS